MRAIMKFGGTSINNKEGIFKVVKIIKNNVSKKNELVIVVSALANITDKLYEAQLRVSKGDTKFVKSFVKDISLIHTELAKESINNDYILKEVIENIEFSLNELESILSALSYLKEYTPRSMDHILSFGERLSSQILCGTLRCQGLKVKLLTGCEAGIITNENFGEAIPLIKLSTQQIKGEISPLFEKEIIPVITGYIACTQNGVTTTLGRGGSDYTATLLGFALDADEVQIWKDVDGIMTADPKMVPSAKTIPVVSYSEATEMAYFGAKVMHPKTLEPVSEKKILVRLKNVFNPKGPETIVVSEDRIIKKGIVKTVAMIKDVGLITISGAGMVGTPGIAAKVFEVLGREKINVLMISQSSSEVGISIIVPRNVLTKAANSLELSLLGSEIVNKIALEDKICIVAVIGSGMVGIPGIAAKVFKFIAEEGINIRMIAQGSSELNISFVIKESEGTKAVQTLHDKFKLNE